MKTIIAGSRTIKDYSIILEAIKLSSFIITTVISGGAVGVDKFGEQYAKENDVPIIQMIPDWSLGKRAGILRNIDMANIGEALIAIWDGKSKGTEHMIKEATKKKLKVFVHIV